MAGRGYQGIFDEVERLMVTWHEAEAELSRRRRAFAVGVVQGNGGTGGVARNPTKGKIRGGGEHE